MSGCECVAVRQDRRVQLLQHDLPLPAKMRGRVAWAIGAWQQQLPQAHKREGTTEFWAFTAIIDLTRSSEMSKSMACVQ